MKLCKHTILTLFSLLVLNACATQYLVPSVHKPNPQVAIVDSIEDLFWLKPPLNAESTMQGNIKFIIDDCHMPDRERRTGTTFDEATWLSYQISDKIEPDTSLIVTIEKGLKLARNLSPEFQPKVYSYPNALLVTRNIENYDSLQIRESIDLLYLCDSLLSANGFCNRGGSRRRDSLGFTFWTTEEINMNILTSQLVDLQTGYKIKRIGKPSIRCAVGLVTQGVKLTQVDGKFVFEFFSYSMEHNRSKKIVYKKGEVWIPLPGSLEKPFTTTVDEIDQLLDNVLDE